MRIGIDARMLGPQCGGLGRYVEQLVIGLEQLDRKNEYIVFLRKDNWERYMPTQANVRKVLADIPWYGWREQAQFPAIVKRENIDLMHFPHWNVPLLYQDPFVVTIHDLIMWHYPRGEASTHGPIVYWLKDRAARLVLRSAARRARRIFAVSEYTKHDVHAALGIPLKKIIVTYQAPFVDKNLELRKQNPESVLTLFPITKPYALYVGSAYPHKNLERLVDAWKSISKETGGAYQLVLAGKDSVWYQKLIQKIRQLESQEIIVTGFVKDDALDALYRDASLYVAPSLYEGYALPALEAISRGIPVVASNRACFPEALGEAALYFDPENTQQMASVILRALHDEAIRLELTTRGREEMRRFAPNELATETLAVYEEIRL